MQDHSQCRKSLDDLYLTRKANDEAEWELDEAKLAAVMAGAVATAGDSAVQAYDRIVGVGSSTDVRRIEEGLQAADSVMQGSFTPDARVQVEETLNRTMLRGSRRVAAGVDLISDIPSRLDVLNGMTRAAGYYTNNYFNRQVMPALFGQVADLLDGADNTDVAAFTAIREAMSQRLKTVPYWRVVANAAASHGYHYGVVKAGQVMGRRGYQLVAILDKKTSSICRELDGRQFWLADAADHIERIAQAEGDEVKNIAPWPALADIQGKDSTALRDAGVMLPPFHGNCRTTLVLVS